MIRMLRPVFCSALLATVTSYADDARLVDFGGVLITSDEPIETAFLDSPTVTQKEFESGELPVHAKEAIRLGRSHAVAVLDQVLGFDGYKVDGVVAAGVASHHGKYAWRVAVAYHLPAEGAGVGRRVEIVVLMNKVVLPPLELLIDPKKPKSN